ncbi:hypothetical protein BC827DRAFT_1153587 [Russula dissimulans]|nr:hypothetical protein BC827DRAFT_1153587 [Russula dissimulans]
MAHVAVADSSDNAGVMPPAVIIDGPVRTFRPTLGRPHAVHHLQAYGLSVHALLVNYRLAGVGHFLTYQSTSRVMYDHWYGTLRRLCVCIADLLKSCMYAAMHEIIVLSPRGVGGCLKTTMAGKDGDCVGSYQTSAIPFPDADLHFVTGRVVHGGVLAHIWSSLTCRREVGGDDMKSYDPLQCKTFRVVRWARTNASVLIVCPAQRDLLIILFYTAWLVCLEYRKRLGV